MRRFNKLLREMSLTQQLMSVVLAFIAMFCIFLYIFLSGNIDAFVKVQMYGIVQRTQDNVIYNYRSNVFTNALYGANDPNVIHIIYFTDPLKTPLTNATTTLNTELQAELIKNTTEQTIETKNYVTYSIKSKMLYTITIINSDARVVSLISNSYMDQFKNALLNSVVNIMLIVVSFLFMLLMVWVGYLIHPLNQIQTYIEKIRRGEKAELKIDRNDEIGEVATALVRMNEELKRQEQLKEEMVQNISHDLKTPIATIKSYGESIKDGIYPYETLEKSVDVIIEHANRLEKKVHSLLLLNRVGYLVGEDKPNARIDMKYVAEKVLQSLKVIRPEIKLSTELTSCSYTGSEEPWRVVIENLLDNALRYAKSVVVIKLNKDELSVYNDGPTLDDDRITKLFKPYEKGTEGQFGMGLAIVYRVVNGYGCTIKAENINGGVLFTIKVKPEKVEKSKKKNSDAKVETA